MFYGRLNPTSIFSGCFWRRQSDSVGANALKLLERAVVILLKFWK
jgi:hypothetical protein